MLRHYKTRAGPRTIGQWRALFERALFCFWKGVFRTNELTNFGLAFPSWPEFFVHLHKTAGALVRFLLGLHFKDGETADNFFGLSERAVNSADLAARKPHAKTGRGRGQSPTENHPAGFRGSFSHLLHFFDE